MSCCKTSKSGTVNDLLLTWEIAKEQLLLFHGHTNFKKTGIFRERTGKYYDTARQSKNRSQEKRR